jgi:hypothetical protein
MTADQQHSERILREFRKAVARKVPPGRSLVDELLEERRAESDEDERQEEASRTGHRAKRTPTDE